MRLKLIYPRPQPRFLSRPRTPALPLLPFRHSITTANPSLIEEQTLPFYHKKRYYPVCIGDTFKEERYRIIAKLGYGGYSTVWLAWDNSTNQYASLEVSIEQSEDKPSPVVNEVNMLRRMKTFAETGDPDNPGLLFTRLATDIFDIHTLSGRHSCMVFKPQGHSLRMLQTTFPDAKVPNPLVGALMHRLFFSLNWLYARCKLIHTDISPLNVLTRLGDEDSFKHIEDQKSQNPSVPIISDTGVAVYQSRHSFLQCGGIPILTDFGNMREDDGRILDDWVMPDIYRAPETLELLEGRNLFDPVDRVHNQYVLPLALAQYIAYLGPPPLHMLRESPHFSTYFDEQGNWTLSEAPIPKTSLEDFVTVIPPGEEKDLFLKFIRRMLVWDPVERAVANEIIDDEWLTGPIEQRLP
ncbi:protein kinase [Aspergillus californicus]